MKRRRKGRKPGSGINAKFAKALKVTEQRISQLRRQGMPITSVAAAKKWVSENVARRTGAVASEMQRLRAAQARLAEMAAAERAGLAVSIDEVDASHMEAMTLLKIALGGIGGRCALDLSQESNPAKIKQRINDEVDRALNAAAAALESWAVGKLAEARRALKAPAKADTGPVG